MLRLVRSGLHIEEILRGVDGWLLDDEAALLADLAGEVRAPNVIVEIGSYRGKSTLVMASQAQVPLYAIDPHECSAGDPTYFGIEDRAIWTENVVHAGVADRVLPINLRSQDVARIWDSKAHPVGLLFVDGAHNLASVRADLDGWIPHVKAGNGLIAVHDLAGGFLGVSEAIQERSDLEQAYPLTDLTVVFRVRA